MADSGEICPEDSGGAVTRSHQRVGAPPRSWWGYAPSIRRRHDAPFEPDLHSIASIKLLLITFELLSGLKINFLKSEVITIGMGQQESRHAANLLNCKLGGFPIKYLGLPISRRKLSILNGNPYMARLQIR